MGFPEAKWTVDQVVSKVGVPPNNMRKFSIESVSATTVSLRFLEPEDSYFSQGGALAVTIEGVMIRMKEGEYPLNPNDGTFVVDNKNLGLYENDPYVVENLTENTTYYFRAFPYSTIGVYNESENEINKGQATPSTAEVVNVTINIDDAKDFSSTNVTLMNITDGTQTTQSVTTASTIVFSAAADKQFKVVVDAVDKYIIETTETEVFTAIASGVRSFTFDYTLRLGFIYTIEFDNGADGIPRSFVYKDDCAGFEPMYQGELGGWKDSPIFDYFNPCVIKPGKRQPEYYLDKNNYNKKKDGTSSILTGADGDVMVEARRLFYKIMNNSTNLKITLSVSNYKVDETYKSFLQIPGRDQDVAYRGVYEAAVASGVLQSVSGKTVHTGVSYSTFLSQSRQRGDGYSMNDFYLLFLWQCMYILLYGSRDSQHSLGQGIVDAPQAAACGALNTRPFCYGSIINPTLGVKFLGVENFYGNVNEIVGGVMLRALSGGYAFFYTRDSTIYNTGESVYENLVYTQARNTGSTLQITGVDEAAFLPLKNAGGSEVYFCDLSTVNPPGSNALFVSFGGHFKNQYAAGAFATFANMENNVNYANVGTRITRRQFF